MNHNAKIQLIVVIGICVGAVSVQADVINGRWVEIPHCAVPQPTQNCGAQAGWPYVEGTHLILTHEGKLLLWKHSMTRFSAYAGDRRAHYWDPLTMMDMVLAPTDVPATNNPLTSGTKNAFCGGHLQLSDGRILIVGGENSGPEALAKDAKPVGVKTVWIFDPATPQLAEQVDDPMYFDRWYATPVLLGDGRVAVIGGGEHIEPGPPPDPGQPPKEWDMAEKPEVYKALADNPGWAPPLNNAVKTDLHLYTFLHLLPGTGSRVISIGPGMSDNSQYRVHKNLFRVGNLDLTTASWTEVTSPADVFRGGSHVRFADNKILKTGGLPAYTDPNPLNAVSSAAIITFDVNTGSIAQIASTANMFAARAEHNLTVLPDGKVLATGGYSEQHEDGEHASDCADGVFHTELWDPATGLWQPLALMTHRTPPIPRMYHSTAALMPDGRVFVAGGECLDRVSPPARDGCASLEGILLVSGTPDTNTTFCMSADYYEPPYLFKGFSTLIDDNDRPDSSNPIKSVAYGESDLRFPVTFGFLGSFINHVALIRPTSVSHSNHMDARRIPLSFLTTAGNDSLQVPTFPGQKLVPPGYYMLFLVNEQGRPSHADFVLFWELRDETVSHTLTINENDTFTLTVTWWTTGSAEDGDDLVLTPPPGVSVGGTFSGSITEGGRKHTKTFVRNCTGATGKWYYEVKSKRPRYASGSVKSVSKSSTRNFTVSACLSF